jgi:hypothetical protein
MVNASEQIHIALNRQVNRYIPKPLHLVNCSIVVVARPSFESQR